MSENNKFLAELHNARQARERKSLEPSAAGDSGVVNAEPGAGGHGGGAVKRKSPEPSAGSVGSPFNAKANADKGGGSAGKQNKPAPSAADDSYCEIVEEGAGERKGGAKTPRGQTLRLNAPFSDSGTKKHDPKCLVKHMSPGESCQVQVETKIPPENLEFLKTKNIESSFDKKGMLVNITALDCTSVKSDFATIQFVHTPTGKVIGTIKICNKSSSVSTSSQQSADTDRCAYLAILGLPPNASESDIKEAYKGKTLLWHPDKEGNTSEWARDMFHRVQEACTALLHKG